MPCKAQQCKLAAGATEALAMAVAVATAVAAAAAAAAAPHLEDLVGPQPHGGREAGEVQHVGGEHRTRARDDDGRARDQPALL